MRIPSLTVLLAASMTASAGTQETAPPVITDANIFALLEQASTGEIGLGRLAVKLAASPDVRELGQAFAADYTQARDKARALATRLGITPVLAPRESLPKSWHDSMPKDNVTAFTKLKGLKGTEFDVAFVAREIDHHQRMIDAVERRLLPAAKHAELRSLLEELKPSLQARLTRARALEQRLAAGT